MILPATWCSFLSFHCQPRHPLYHSSSSHSLPLPSTQRCVVWSECTMHCIFRLPALFVLYSSRGTYLTSPRCRVSLNSGQKRDFFVSELKSSKVQHRSPMEFWRTVGGSFPVLAWDARGVFECVICVCFLCVCSLWYSGGKPYAPAPVRFFIPPNRVTGAIQAPSGSTVYTTYFCVYMYCVCGV